MANRIAIAWIALCWIATASTARVIDGDTFVADLAIWPGLTIRETVRIVGVDTPEVHGPSREAGLKAREFASSWLAAGPFSVEVCRRDSFGRALGRVFRGASVLGDELLGAGHAREFDG